MPQKSVQLISWSKCLGLGVIPGKTREMFNIFSHSQQYQSDKMRIVLSRVLSFFTYIVMPHTGPKGWSLHCNITIHVLLFACPPPPALPQGCYKCSSNLLEEEKVLDLSKGSPFKAKISACTHKITNINNKPFCAFDAWVRLHQASSRSDNCRMLWIAMYNVELHFKVAMLLFSIRPHHRSPLQIPCL